MTKVRKKAEKQQVSRSLLLGIKTIIHFSGTVVVGKVLEMTPRHNGMKNDAANKMMIYK